MSQHHAPRLYTKRCAGLDLGICDNTFSCQLNPTVVWVENVPKAVISELMGIVSEGARYPCFASLTCEDVGHSFDGFLVRKRYRLHGCPDCKSAKFF
jgi:hypothetical protein